MRSVDADAADIESFVRLTLAAVCRTDAAQLCDTTSLLALHADSLTLVTVLSRVELRFGIDFSTSDTAELLSANDVGELIAAVLRRMATPSPNPDAEPNI